MLQAVGDVRHHVPRVGVSQEVVDSVTTGNRTHQPDRVHVVVRRANALLRLQQTLGHESQRRRKHQLARASRDQQAAFIDPSSDLDVRVFHRRFVQIRASQQVTVRTPTSPWVVGSDQRLAVTTEDTRASESVVQNRRSLDLFRVRHRTSEGLRIPRGERVVQIVLDRLFGNGEAHRNRLVRVTSRPRFLRGVVRNGSAFGFHRSGTKARQFRFFLEGTIRRLALEDLGVLLSVSLVLQTEQTVKSRKEFLEQLGT